MPDYFYYKGKKQYVPIQLRMCGLYQYLYTLRLYLKKEKFSKR